MARIRTVKPEFYRHELLQHLERHHPGLRPMLVFSGLWTLCDKLGQFEWKPRQIHLDLLPYVDFEMEDTLQVLEDAGMVLQYEVDGKFYGLIPSFKTHQRISGKEVVLPPRYPVFSSEALVKHRGIVSGSTGETLVKQRGSTGEVPLFAIVNK